MSFGRHRQQSTDQRKPVNSPVVIEGDIIVHPKLIEKEDNQDTTKGQAGDKPGTEKTEPVKEEIKKVPQKKPRKKRQDKKEYTNIGIIGNTVVCKDFRAIVKKRGDQINVVLTKILHDWNTKNYNL